MIFLDGRQFSLRLCPTLWWDRMKDRDHQPHNIIRQCLSWTERTGHCFRPSITRHADSGGGRGLEIRSQLSNLPRAASISEWRQRHGWLGYPPSPRSHLPISGMKKKTPQQQQQKLTHPASSFRPHSFLSPFHPWPTTNPLCHLVIIFSCIFFWSVRHQLDVGAPLSSDAWNYTLLNIAAIRALGKSSAQYEVQRVRRGCGQGGV